MPAYSYKERFVPMVKDGSKPHTIRSRRKNPAKPGSKHTSYLFWETLYTGNPMRKIKQILLAPVAFILGIAGFCFYLLFIDEKTRIK
jgi:hypothetical protein